MKKSTLITTIAMIVVVVVALSTATYAWFSANSFATANVSLTTKSSADWSLVVGTKGSADGNGLYSYTFTNTAVDAYDATTALESLVTGLHSTETALTGALNGTSTQTEAKVAYKTFYEANTKTSDTATVKTVLSNVEPIVVKVSNSSGSEKTLVLTVVVNAGATVESTGTLYAASAFSYNIQYLTSLNNAEVTTATNGYYIGAAQATYVEVATYTADTTFYKYADSTYTAVEGITDEGSFATALSTNGKLYKQVSSLTDNGVSVAKGALQGTDLRPTYNQATAKTGNQYSLFTAATAQDAKDFGVTEGDQLRKYTIEIGTFSATDSVVVVIYPWIDGWVADPSAAGADFDVCFGFTSKVVTD